MMELLNDMMLIDRDNRLCKVWKVLKLHHPESYDERVLGAKLFMIACHDAEIK